MKKYTIYEMKKTYKNKIPYFSYNANTTRSSNVHTYIYIPIYIHKHIHILKQLYD